MSRPARAVVIFWVGLAATIFLEWLWPPFLPCLMMLSVVCAIVFGVSMTVYEMFE